MNQNSARKSLPLVVVGIGGILLVVAGLWTMSGRSPAPGTPVPTTIAPTIDSAQVPRVSLDEAKGAYEAGSAVFVDVRSRASYEASHIPGALSIPLGEIADRLQELDPGRWIITYCS